MTCAGERAYGSPVVLGGLNKLIDDFLRDMRATCMMPYPFVPATVFVKLWHILNPVTSAQLRSIPATLRRFVSGVSVRVSLLIVRWSIPDDLNAETCVANRIRLFGPDLLDRHLLMPHFAILMPACSVLRAAYPATRPFHPDTLPAYLPIARVAYRRVYLAIGRLAYFTSFIFV